MAPHAMMMIDTTEGPEAAVMKGGDPGVVLLSRTMADLTVQGEEERDYIAAEAVQIMADSIVIIDHAQDPDQTPGLVLNLSQRKL